MSDDVVRHAALATLAQSTWAIVTRGNEGLIVSDDPAAAPDVLVVRPRPAPCHHALGLFRTGIIGAAITADQIHDLEEVLHAVAGGLLVCSPRLRVEALRMPQVTDRQVRLLAAVVRGFSNDEIGDELGYSAATIRRDVSDLARVFAVSGRRHLVAKAIELGFS